MGDDVEEGTDVGYQRLPKLLMLRVCRNELAGVRELADPRVFPESKAV